MAAPWMAERARVTKRITGKLIEWKGKYGWIKPTEAIDHPDASKRGGKVYIAQEDVEEEVQVKGVVSFLTYVDETGLGAMHCKAASAAVQAQAAAKGAAKGAIGKGAAGKGDSNGATGLKGATSRTGTQAAKGQAPAKGAGKSPGPKGVQKTILKQQTGPAGKGIKGSGKATGEVQEERGPPPPPDKATRQRIMPGRITGKLMKWRGVLGWIRPSEPIDHPEAEKHKKGIYLHEVDVQSGHEMFNGAEVKFFLYADEDGLGAEHCMLNQAKGQGTEETGKGAASGKGTASGKGAAIGKGAVGGKGKASGKGKANDNADGVQKLKLKKNKGKGGKKGGEEKEIREKRPGGPDLPRERITDIPVAGEVIEWKKKFGWLRPLEAIEHEKADVHGGKVYIHEKDVIPEGPLEVGQTVEFHVYVDENSLGAEECIQT